MDYEKDAEEQDFRSMNSNESSIDIEIKLLKKNIFLCDERKENLKRYLRKLREQYGSGEISYGKYEFLSSHYLHGKSSAYWLGHYDDYKTMAQLKINQLSYASLCREAIIEKPVVEDELTSKKKRIEELEAKVLKLGTISGHEEKSDKKDAEEQDFRSMNSNELSIDFGIELFKKNIALCDERKENLKRYLRKLREQYGSGEISYGKYEFLSSHYLHGKSSAYWLGHYDDYKTMAQLKINQLSYASLCREAIIEKPVVEDELTRKKKRIEELEAKALQLEKIIIRDEESTKPKFSIDGKVLTVFLLLLIILPGTILMYSYIAGQNENGLDLTSYSAVEVNPVRLESNELGITDGSSQSFVARIFNTFSDMGNSITGYSVDLIRNATEDNLAVNDNPKNIPEVTNLTMPELNVTIPVENITENVTEINATEINMSGNATIPAANLTMPELNVTIPVENITIYENITQLPAEIDHPVGWLKKIRLDPSNNTLTIQLPAKVSGIKARKIIDGKEEDIEKITRKKGSSVIPIDSVSENITEIVLEGLIGEAEVEYYTPAPKISEVNTGVYNKLITISSELHYTNVTAFVNISEIASDANAIHLYWVVNDTRQEVANVVYLDSDSDTLIDALQWIVPHLSNQTYEISISIINVQSYPTVGGNWTVMFNTTGTANLTITAFNGTTWTNYSSSGNDLKFLEVRCGSQIKQYEWIGNSAVIPDYNCSSMGYEVSKVLTAGKHNLELDFGGQKAYAYNQAGGSVQRGYVSGTGQLSDTIALTNTSQAFALFTSSSGQTTPDDSQFTVNISDTSTIAFTRYNAAGVDARISWEVINSGDFVVQRGTAALAANTNETSIQINPVNTSSSFAIVYGRCADNTAGDTYAGFFTVNISNSTGILLRRGRGILCAATASWQVVQWDGAIVQSGETTIATGSQSNTGTINSVNLSQSFLVFSTANIGSTAAMRYWRIGGNISSSTQVLFTKNTGGGTLDQIAVNWYVVEVPGAYVQNGFGASAGNISRQISPINLSSTFHTISNYNAGTGATFTNYYFLSNISNSTSIEISKYSTSQINSNIWFIVQMPNAVTVNSDYPLFTNFRVNDTLLKLNDVAKFNMTVTDATETIAAANGTIGGINMTFSSGAGTEWYNDTKCTVSGDLNFSAAWAQDTGSPINSNTTAIPDISAVCDATAPSITNARINATSPLAINSVVKVNATITDAESHLQSVILEIRPPVSPAYNVTPTQSGDEFFNNTIRLTEAGQWVFRFYANDTVGNDATPTLAVDGAANQYIEISSGASAPVIYSLSTIAAQSVTESSFTDVSFVVSVLDANGIDTIRNSSAMNASAKFPGATTRTNLSCERIENINTTAANYSCTVRLWYWDAAGVWTVNVSVNDTSNSISNVKATTFTLGATTAVVMAPNTLTWPNLFSTATNQTPTNTPLRINNTANRNLTNINITAINLQGISDTSKILNASDFSINYTTGGSPAFECGGYVLKNQTAVTDATRITGMAINPNNNTAGFGNSTVYICMLRVTSLASPQEYSTSNVGRWTVTVG